MSDTPRGRIEAALREHRWLALGGIGAFVAAGLLIAGLVRHQAAPSAPGRQRTPALQPTPPSASGPGGSGLFESAPPPEASLGDEHEFDCMISPNDVVDIGSAITGLIESVYVERGDYVEQGQMLAMLESNVEQAAVKVARARAEREVNIRAGQANLSLSRKRQERARQLYESNSLSKDLGDQANTEARLAELELERARADHQLASLELEQAIAALKRRVILAPVSGLVVERLMSPGEVVERETIMRIAEIDVLRVEVILPSRLFGSVESGDVATLVPEPPYDTPRSAEVAIVDRIIDGASGTFGVRLLLPNEDHDLPGGLRCRVSFTP